MKCRVAKKVCRHFWSRFFDPDNPRHRTSTVKKAIQVYDKPLRKKIMFRRLVTQKMELSNVYNSSSTAY